MPITTDNALDQELAQMMALLTRTKTTQTVFSNTFPNLPPKDRAKTIKQIQADHKTLAGFLEKAKRSEVWNSGTKFRLENLRQSYQSLIGLWRKTEKNLETFSGGSAPKAVPHGSDETTRAVEKYIATLRSAGRIPTPEMVDQFKTKLTTAYEKAKAQSGGKDLAIDIVQEGSKIKVRLERK